MTNYEQTVQANQEAEIQYLEALLEDRERRVAALLYERRRFLTHNRRCTFDLTKHIEELLAAHAIELATGADAAIIE